MPNLKTMHETIDKIEKDVLHSLVDNKDAWGDPAALARHHPVSLLDLIVTVLGKCMKVHLAPPNIKFKTTGEELFFYDATIRKTLIEIAGIILAATLSIDLRIAEDLYGSDPRLQKPPKDRA